MAGMSDYLENKLIDQVFRGQTPIAPVIYRRGVVMSISVPQGADHSVEITGLGDLTEAVGHLQVKDAAGTIVVHKATDVPGEGELVAPEDTSGAMRFYLIPADTAELTPGAYRYDIWVVYGNGKKYQVREVKNFTVGERVTVV